MTASRRGRPDSRGRRASRQDSLRGWTSAHAVGLLVLLTVGIGYLVLALRLSAGELSRPGEGFFPRAVGVLLIVSSVLALAHARRSPAEPAAQDDDPGDEQFGDAAWRVPLLIGAVLAYVLLAPLAGHLVVASLVSFVVMMVLNARPWWQMAAVAVVLGVGTHVLFRELLSVALPEGQWFS